jgi:hypothetical protein
MQTRNPGRLLAFAVVAAVPLLMSTMAQAQAPAPAPAAVPAPPPPQLPPFLVPSLSVDLMTAAGSAAFGAQWKTKEAVVVERPPLPGHLPGYDKGYDISPHAGEAGYDDSAWTKSRPRTSRPGAAVAMCRSSGTGPT